MSSVLHTMSEPDTSGSKIRSIPIANGPAQFNAFYPQCSGSKILRSPRIRDRSTADRILSIIKSKRVGFRASNYDFHHISFLKIIAPAFRAYVILAE